jgi:hypothetical protein
MAIVEAPEALSVIIRIKLPSLQPSTAITA